MQMRVIALGAWLACAGVLFGETPDKEKLRQLADLPEISITFGFPFSLTDAAKEPATPEAIKRVLQQMKGDASDAQNYVRLGDLYGERKETAESEAAHRKAVQLYRDQIKQRPKDGVLHARLAEVLRNLDQDKEAETELCKGLELAPRSAKCGIEMARLLYKKSQRLLFNYQGRSSNTLTLKEKLKQMLASPPAPQQIAEIRRLLDAGRRCMDRAAALEPNNIEVYECRMGWHLSVAFDECCLRVLKGEKIDPCTECMNAMITPAFYQDVYEFRRRKESINSRDATIRIMLELCLGSKSSSESKQKNKNPFDLLSSTSQQVIRKELKKLERWMKGSDKEAAQAAEFHGMLSQMILEDAKVAEASLRRALSLDPSCRNARELLLMILEGDQRIGDAVEIQRAALRHYDSARDRFLLARLLESGNRPQEAQEQLTLGLRRDPQDILCSLGLAALLMRSRDESSLKEAGKYLEQAKKDLEKSGSPKLLVEYNLLLGIHEGLCDRAEDAQALLNKAAEQGAEKRANKVLAVLSKSVRKK